MTPLDRDALLTADLAFMEESGTNADKMAAAVAAYLWALDWAFNHSTDPLPTAPSLNDWREHRATLGSLR